MYQKVVKNSSESWEVGGGVGVVSALDLPRGGARRVWRARCGVVWCGVVWCGMVWYGVVWYGIQESRGASGGVILCK